MVCHVLESRFVAPVGAKQHRIIRISSSDKGIIKLPDPVDVTS
jgi:hypothetical protein